MRAPEQSTADDYAAYVSMHKRYEHLAKRLLVAIGLIANNPEVYRVHVQGCYDGCDLCTPRDSEGALPNGPRGSKLPRLPHPDRFQALNNALRAMEDLAAAMGDASAERDALRDVVHLTAAAVTRALEQLPKPGLWSRLRWLFLGR